MGRKRTSSSVAQAVELRVDGPPAVQEILQAPSSLQSALQDRLDAAEQQLVQQLFLSRPPGPMTTVFSGVGHQVGATRLCARAALTLAPLIDGDVCVVDANLRSPGLAEFLGIGNTFGFSDFVTSDGPLREYVRRVGRSNLYVMTAGSDLSNPRLALSSIKELYGRLMELRSVFDYVLIDSAPVNAYPDVSVIGPATDGVVVVVQANKTRRAAVSGAVDRLRAANANILGVILNQREYPVPEAIYQMF